MKTKIQLNKTIIFDNKDYEDYWLEEPLREEYYRSEIETMRYLNSKEKELEFNNDEIVNKFVEEYLNKNGKTSGDIAVFIKELRSFLKTYKEDSIKNNRIG